MPAGRQQLMCIGCLLNIEYGNSCAESDMLPICVSFVHSWQFFFYLFVFHPSIRGNQLFCFRRKLFAGLQKKSLAT